MYKTGKLRPYCGILQSWHQCEKSGANRHYTQNQICCIFRDWSWSSSWIMGNGLDTSKGQ